MGWRLKKNKESWSLHHIIDKGRDKATGKKIRPSRVLLDRELIENGFDPTWSHERAKAFYKETFQAKEEIKRQADKKAKTSSRSISIYDIEGQMSSVVLEALIIAMGLDNYGR